jgi:hypothetical protein
VRTYRSTVPRVLQCDEGTQPCHTTVAGFAMNLALSRPHDQRHAPPPLCRLYRAGRQTIRKMPPCNAPNSDTQCSTTQPQPLHHEVHSSQTGCYNSQNNLLTTARPHSLTATNVVSPMQAQQSVLICAASSRSASHSTVRLLRFGVEHQQYVVAQLTPLLTSP